MAELLTINAHGRSYRIEDPGGLIGRPLRAGHPYEAKVCEHIYRRGLKGVAIDAGAHVGNHSLWLAAVCGLDVHAFEALPDVRELLRHNVELNEHAKISVHDCALGSSAGTARQIGKGQLAADGDIEVSTLDSFALTDVALIKVDVEGMEPDVLVGATETIRAHRPVLYVEAWDKQAHERIADLLAPLGYQHARTFGATPLEEWSSEGLPC